VIEEEEENGSLSVASLCHLALDDSNVEVTSLQLSAVPFTINKRAGK
jgi:hypothetical protein